VIPDNTNNNSLVQRSKKPKANAAKSKVAAPVEEDAKEFVKGPVEK
jgi:hypothetical protein